MSIQVKQVQKYLASDGTEHTSRASAVEHEKSLKRVQNLKAIWANLDGSGELADSVDPVAVIVFLAKNGKALVEALNVVEARGPRKSKDAA